MIKSQRRDMPELLGLEIKRWKEKKKQKKEKLEAEKSIYLDEGHNITLWSNFVNIMAGSGAGGAPWLAQPAWLSSAVQHSASLSSWAFSFTLSLTASWPNLLLARVLVCCNPFPLSKCRLLVLVDIVKCFSFFLFSFFAFSIFCLYKAWMYYCKSANMQEIKAAVTLALHFQNFVSPWILSRDKP